MYNLLLCDLGSGFHCNHLEVQIFFNHSELFFFFLGLCVIKVLVILDSKSVSCFESNYHYINITMLAYSFAQYAIFQVKYVRCDEKYPVTL